MGETLDWEAVGLRLGAFFIILTVELVCGALPLVVRRLVSSDDLRDRLLSLGNAFAGGLFLASGFVHLLRESLDVFQEQLGEDYEIPFGVLLCPIGFGLAFFVEKVLFLRDPPHFHEESNPFTQDTKEPQQGYDVIDETKPLNLANHAHNNDHDQHNLNAEEESNGHVDDHHNHTHYYSHTGYHEHDHHAIVLAHNPSPVLPYVLVAILSLHSIIAGVALALQVDFDVALSIFIALISHKWIEAFALGVSLLKAGKEGFSFFKLLFMFAITCPLGIVIGSALYAGVAGSSAGDIVTAVLTAIASGTFVYVAIVDILLEEFQIARDKYIKFFLATLGFFSMASLMFAFDHNHGDDHAHDH